MRYSPSPTLDSSETIPGISEYYGARAGGLLSQGSWQGVLCRGLQEAGALGRRELEESLHPASISILGSKEVITGEVKGLGLV